MLNTSDWLHSFIDFRRYELVTVIFSNEIDKIEKMIGRGSLPPCKISVKIFGKTSQIPKLEADSCASRQGLLQISTPRTPQKIIKIRFFFKHWLNPSPWGESGSGLLHEELCTCVVACESSGLGQCGGMEGLLWLNVVLKGAKVSAWYGARCGGI